MESLFFRLIFEKLIDGVMILIVTGGIVAATIDLQKSAFHSKGVGLVSMLKVNQQLTRRSRQLL